MSNVLVITGGSHGIGEKTISLFMQKGWKVVNISRSNCSLPHVHNLNIDLSSPDWSQQYKQPIQSSLEHAEKICLVHNAAAFASDNISSLSCDDFRSILNVNLVSPVALNQVVIPHMKMGSSIIYIGSTLSEQAVPNRASYVISKHAVIGLMRSTCQDLAGKDIHSCCVCPGFVNTKMLTEHIDIDVLKNFISKKVIAKRLIEPQEIAELIHFSAMNPIINGSVLHANLGQVDT
jgi:3-oxoacyl-[acyl-carrier protein] reductase